MSWFPAGRGRVFNCVPGGFISHKLGSQEKSVLGAWDLEVLMDAVWLGDCSSRDLKGRKTISGGGKNSLGLEGIHGEARWPT